MGSRRIGRAMPLIIDTTGVVTAAGNHQMVMSTVIVVMKTAGAATTVTLPASPVKGQFAAVVDGKGDAASNNITVVPAGTGTINGASSVVINANYGRAEFRFNGTEWNLFSLDGTSTGGNNTVPGNQTVTGNSAITGNQTVTGNSTITGNQTVTGTETTTGGSVLGNNVQRAGGAPASVNAAGTAIGNATSISSDINIVAGANGNTGVAIAASAFLPGAEIVVVNTDASNALKVYPPVNSQLNAAGVNAALSVAAAKTAVIRVSSATQAYSQIGA